MWTLDTDKSIFNTEVEAKINPSYICSNDVQQCKKNDRMVQGSCLFCNLITLNLLTLQTETVLNLYQELMAEGYTSIWHYPFWRHF